MVRPMGRQSRRRATHTSRTQPTSPARLGAPGGLEDARAWATRHHAWPGVAGARRRAGVYRRAMPRERPLPGGKLEYAVLVGVWEGGTVTVRELHERVGAPLGLVYTT